MGEGLILSEIGNGLYQVRLIFNDQLDTKLAQIATKRAELESKLLQLRAAQLDLNEAWTNAHRNLLNNITAWENDIVLPTDPVLKPPAMSATAYEYTMRTASKIGLPDAVTAAFLEASKKAQEMLAGERDIDEKQAEYLALLKRQNELTTLKNTEIEGIPAWCADYTEGLTGHVATLEVFGEVNPPIGGGINIKPGFNSAAWAPSYGKLQRSAMLSSSGFVWNFTMLNPWEKWMPKWRYAKIIAIDKDTNLVNLELLPVVSTTYSYLSKIKTLNESLESSMTDVVVEYMGCNALAFEINDEVVVEFTKTGDLYIPKVIGFKDHPLPCIEWPASEVGVFQFITGPQTNLDFENFARKTTCSPPCPEICWNGGIYQALWERNGEFVLTFDFFDPDFEISPIGNYSLEPVVIESRTRQRFFRSDVIFNLNLLGQTGSMNMTTYSQTSDGGNCSFVGVIDDEFVCIPYECFRYPGDFAEIVTTVYNFTTKEQFAAWIIPQLPYLTVRHIATGRTKQYPATEVIITNFVGPKFGVIYEKPN